MTLYSALIVALTIQVANPAHAACPSAPFTPPEKVSLLSKTTLIVTHASSQWDDHEVSRRGINRAIAIARGYNFPIVYLQDNEASSYFYDYCQPTYFIYSFAGEFAFDFESTHIISVGGHFEACQQETVKQILRTWATRQPKSDLRLSFIGNAIYMFGQDVRKTDSYYEAYEWYKSISANNKITLAELLKIIGHEDLQLDFVHRYLSRLEFPIHYKVVIELNHTVKEIYRQGTSSPSPTLTIDFISDNSLP